MIRKLGKIPKLSELSLYEIEYLKRTDTVQTTDGTKKCSRFVNW